MAELVDFEVVLIVKFVVLIAPEGSAGVGRTDTIVEP